MSFNRDWFEKLGGFAEEYVFGHYEDADLCLKSLEAGVAPWIHDLKLWHLESRGSTPPPTLEGALTVNRWLFNRRWGPKVIPEMLGKSPRHPLLENQSEIMALDIGRESSEAQVERHSVRLVRSLGGARTPDGDLGIGQYQEIVFSADPGSSVASA